MIFITSFVIVILCALLHRMRGDASWKPDWLKGRALFYVGPLIGIVAALDNSATVSFAFAAGYVFFAIWSWGHTLARIGGITPARPAEGLDAVLVKFPGTAMPVFFRMLMITPAVAGVAYLTGSPMFMLAAPAFALTATVLYHILFRDIGHFDWLRAELAIGGLFGVLVVLA